MGELRAQNVALTNGAEQSAPRCVVLLCPGGSLPAPLRHAFSRRGIELHECSDPLAAMTTLCLLAGTSAGRLSGARLILLIIEPARQRHLNDLKRAVERYVPDVVCRAYREHEPTHIGPLEQGSDAISPADPPSSAPTLAAGQPPIPVPEVIVPPAERTAEASASYAAQRAGPPQLRLAGVDENAGESDSESEPEFAMEPMGESEPLTAEELAMLLADDEDEAQER